MMSMDGLQEPEQARGTLHLPAVSDPDRLRSVRDSGLLETSSESFDRLTRLARVLLGVPATFLSIVDEDRDVYLSQIGFGEPLRTTRSITGRTFCHLAIDRGGPLVIEDTGIDPVHRAIPTVESLGVAAYLGVPVRLPDDQVLGSFCAIDHEPRAWTTTELDVMVELARSAEVEIALHELRRTMDELERSYWHIRKLQDVTPLCMSCHRIHRPGEGWEPLVEYLARDGMLVSHGYCPDCARAARDDLPS